MTALRVIALHPLTFARCLMLRVRLDYVLTHAKDGAR